MCGTATDWRDRARAALDGLSEIAAERAAVEEALTELHSWVHRELAPALDGGPPTEAEAALVAFTTAVGYYGCVARGDAHRAGARGTRPDCWITP